MMAIAPVMESATIASEKKKRELAPSSMPPMTMVFVARDKSMLDMVKAGDKVRFMVLHENGQMIVTDIQPIK